MTPESARREAGAYAALIFGLAASLTYLLERLYERSRTKFASDPRSIIFEPRTMFYWRAFVAVWFGTVIALFVYRWITTRGELPRQWISGLLYVFVALLPVSALWAWRFP